MRADAVQPTASSTGVKLNVEALDVYLRLRRKGGRVRAVRKHLKRRVRRLDADARSAFKNLKAR